MVSAIPLSRDEPNNLHVAAERLPASDLAAQGHLASGDNHALAMVRVADNRDRTSEVAGHRRDADGGLPSGMPSALRACSRANTWPRCSVSVAGPVDSRIEAHLGRLPARRRSLARDVRVAGALAAALAGLLLGASACIAAPDEPKRILVLHSFGLQFAPYHAFASRLRVDLAERWPHPIELHETALDTALLAEPDAELPFLAYLAALFSKRQPDLVVPIGAPAVRFVQKHREELFQTTPMVIAGVEQRHLDETALTALDTAVTHRLDFPDLVEDILQVLPQTNQLHVVLGASPLERFWQAELERELGPFADHLAVTFWSDLGFDAMRQRAARLPAGSAILYGLLLVDADGIPHEQSQALGGLRAVASAPIFGVFDSDLGMGVVGGHMIPVAGMSEKAADVVARILGGESPASIRTPPTGSAGPSFDWRELRQWHIPEARLPRGSEIHFREPGPWERYRWRIVGVALFILIQALLIVGLLANQIQRRRAERRLSESEDRLALAADDVGIWVWDSATDRVLGNARWCALFGLEPARTFSLETVMGRIHPADREEVREAVRHALTERTAYLGEFRVDLPGGARRWLSARGRPEATSPRSGGRLLGATIDITERRAAEESARDLSRRLLRSQEQERARIARELHDDMTQRLARLAIDAGNVEQTPAAREVRPAVEALRQGLVRLSDDVHAMSHRLHPAVLEDLGLVDALRAECDRCAQSSDTTVVLSVGDLPAPVAPGLALCLFRIAQEALRNALRHAQAREVKVSLASTAEGLQLAVQDDGVGFDPGAEARSRTLGLASMRERVSLLGGELDVESQLGTGTLVLAWVPLAEVEP
jgi:PAS domain S-box-containing protein